MNGADASAKGGCGPPDGGSTAVGQRHIGWARLLKRLFDIDLRRCPSCGAGELKSIAPILQRAAIEKIRTQLGLAPRPPPPGRASEPGHAGHAFAAG